jgi:mono/diheme cytochrome c family protein
MKLTQCALVVVLTTMASTGALWAHGKTAARRAPVSSEEKQAFEAARPVFEEHCFSCHTSEGGKSRRKALQHVSMDGYPFGGHHAGDVAAAIREALGDPPTMPSDHEGAVKGAELEKVMAWADAVDRATHKPGSKAAPASHGAHHTP